jgi:hypothetical protein
MSTELKQFLSREAGRIRPAPAPIDEMLADVRTQVRHRRQMATAAAAVLAVLAVAGSWAIGRLDGASSVDRPADVVPSESSWGPFRAGDTIFVGDAAVIEKKLSDRFVAVPDGVVYPTTSGQIVFATVDGERSVIGRGAGTHPEPPGQHLPEPASDPSTGWVSWFEPASTGGEIVVYDTTRGAEIDRLDVGYSGSRECSTARSGSYGPFAVDGETVYYCTAAGDYAWRPTAGEAPRRIFPVDGLPGTSDDYLLDVRNGVRVVLRDTSEPRPVTVVQDTHQPGQSVVIGRSLLDGFLSYDGRYLAGTRERAMSVYDTATGNRLPIDSADAGRLPLTMTFTDDGGVAYAVTDGPEHTDRWDVVVCELPDGPCRTEFEDLDGGVFFANQRIQ